MSKPSQLTQAITDLRAQIATLQAALAILEAAQQKTTAPRSPSAKEG